MGFRPPRKIYTLDFTGTDYDGAHVRMRGTTLAEQIHVEDLRASDAPDSGLELFEFLASLLVDWNIEDDNEQPVPATLDGVRAQDFGFTVAIMNALQTAVTGVSAPLEPSSADGEPSAVASIPMEPLSDHPAPTAVPA
jgi:hypothetical protein